MEYITVQEAAKKWKISERLVQKYCAEGRIDGVCKFGKSWGIPASAVKPQDPRKEKGRPVPQHSPLDPKAFLGFMPLMNTPFEPGRCMEYINEMEDGPRKGIALAEYHYFSGQPEKAIQEAELYLTCPDAAYRLSACWIYAYANLSVGQIQHARYALTEIKNTLAANAEEAPYIRAIEAFVVFASSVLLHLPLPEKMPPAQEFLPLLPSGQRSFALYVQAHYLYLKEDYGKSVGIVEATLDMGADQYPIPAIYLHLVAVMDYMSLKQTQQAQKHLLAAWKIARPNAVVCVVALYEEAQTLPLPDMYGKNLTFKTGGVDGCNCDEILNLIASGKLDTTSLITHRYPLSKALEAYDLFEQKKDHVIKAVLKP